jgi:hypothetical protein
MYSGIRYLHLTISCPTFRIKPVTRAGHVREEMVEGGFPHSEIRGSKVVRTSPRLIAAYHVLHSLSMPRHPPNALKALDRSHYRCLRPDAGRQGRKDQLARHIRECCGQAAPTWGPARSNPEGLADWPDISDFTMTNSRR